jgi:hypothetical protein
LGHAYRTCAFVLAQHQWHSRETPCFRMINHRRSFLSIERYV